MKVAVSGVLSLAVTLFGLLLFTFLLTTLSPVDPALRIAGDHASESSLAQVRSDLGLDQPWPSRFGHYLNNLRQGDLGCFHYVRAAGAGRVEPCAACHA
ncbi:hypothetical protein CU661_19615 [Pseudomonas syringae pv. actinidifoliorum]|nr:hypothetical protein [Pseudomonas syringae pv. actinidifoliorum]